MKLPTFTDARGLDTRARYVAVVLYDWQGKEIHCGVVTNIRGVSAFHDGGVDERLSDEDLVKIAVKAWTETPRSLAAEIERSELDGRKGTL